MGYYKSYCRVSEFLMNSNRWLSYSPKLAITKEKSEKRKEGRKNEKRNRERKKKIKKQTNKRKERMDAKMKIVE